MIATRAGFRLFMAGLILEAARRWADYYVMETGDTATATAYREIGEAIAAKLKELGALTGRSQNEPSG